MSALLVSGLMCACAASPAARPDPERAVTADFNGASMPANDCWARLYERDSFSGRMLTLAGPVRVGDLARPLGFPWDPRYESLVVGRGAVLSLFADPDFRHREAVFNGGTMVRDLDDEMGVFRRTRSVTVACTDTPATRRP